MWIMKLTKTLIASVALATFALPMTATAQVGPNDVIGSLANVSGPVYIKRGGQFLRAVENSAILANDVIAAEPSGSAMVNLNGCNGKFAPCNQFVNGGNMVSLTSNNYCGDLAALLPLGPGDAILSAGAASGSSLGGVAAGGASIGTAFPATTLLAILGAGALGFAAFEIFDDDDDDDDDDIAVPTSP